MVGIVSTRKFWQGNFPLLKRKMKLMGTLWRRLVKILTTIAKLDSNPRKIAGSVALGVFIGSIPIPGLQCWTALLMSIILRVNKVGTILSLEIYSNPLTLPFLCYIDFKIGELLLAQSLNPLTWRDFQGLNWDIILGMAKPLFLGSLVLGTVAALLAYPVSLVFVSRYKEDL